MQDKTLLAELRLIIEEHSVNYAINRVAEIIAEHERVAEEHGYVIGWNACLDDMPDRMKLSQKRAK